MRMIGILGGYGDIGERIVKRLMDRYTILIGGRNALLKQETFMDKGNLRFQNVDIYNPTQLLEFVKSCKLVINCTGPSWKNQGIVEKACMENNIHLLDIGFPEPIKHYKGEKVGRTILYGVGTSPGLSGLLQIYLGQDFDSIEEMNVFFGGRDTFTKVAAEDYLHGITNEKNIPLAMWKQSKVVLNSKLRLQEKVIPFFNDTVNVYPYVDEESLLVVDRLKPQKGTWNLVVEGKKMNKLLDQARIFYPDRSSAAIHLLCEGSQLEMLGKESYVIFLIEIKGITSGNKRVKTLMLKAKSQADLTSMVVAESVEHVLGGNIENGIKSLSEISKASDFIKSFVDKMDEVKSYIYDSSIDQLNYLQEGEI